MSNQRKNKRHACFVPVEGKDGSVFDVSQTVDFSKRGLGFVSKKRIPVNKEIPIEIALSTDGQSAIVIGKVQWVRRIVNSDSYRIGVSFTDIKRGSKSRLDEYFKVTNAA